jgi:hypothetical protein
MPTALHHRNKDENQDQTFAQKGDITTLRKEGTFLLCVDSP